MRRNGLAITLGPPSRWWLEGISTIDELAPGFAGAALRASNDRKQVIAACLAAKIKRTGDRAVRGTFDSAGAADLLQKRHKHLLAGAFGSCPPGFRGAIIRLTSIHSDIHVYFQLHHIFAEKEMRSVARALMHCGNIIPRKIELCRRLPEPFRRPAIIRKFAPSDHDELLLVLSMAKVLRPTATAGEIVSNAKWLGRSGSLPSLLHAWLRKAKMPPSPLNAMFPWRHIDSVADLKRIGRDFRNCAATYIFKGLSGRSHFYLCVVGDEKAVAHLEQLPGRQEYMLAHVEAPKGEYLSRRADQMIEAAFAKEGIVRNGNPDALDPWWVLENVYARLPEPDEHSLFDSELDSLAFGDQPI